MLKVSGKWNDNHCSSKKPFICKAKTGMDLLLENVCSSVSLLGCVGS